MYCFSGRQTAISSWGLNSCLDQVRQACGSGELHSSPAATTALLRRQAHLLPRQLRRLFRLSVHASAADASADLVRVRACAGCWKCHRCTNRMLPMSIVSRVRRCPSPDSCPSLAAGHGAVYAGRVVSQAVHRSRLVAATALGVGALAWRSRSLSQSAAPP